ncbi:MAG: MAPEG family protein [Proteobacteria bacterium]|nr:MAPEG family protein [Pseudomonadota bacterium]
MKPLAPELYWLLLTVILTGLLWVPYILRTIADVGVPTALSETEGVLKAEAIWAQRAKRAHANAVENLIVFAPLVLLVHATGAGNGATALACAIYFYARLAHYAVYTLGIPYLRTPAFAVGFFCQVTLALRLLGVV